MATSVRVIGLHKLPFDPAAFERDMDSVKDCSPDIWQQLRLQYRQNWDNAWLVVIEWDGPAREIDFSAFRQGTGPNAQAAWLEEIIEDSPTKTKAAFFLHYVKPAVPLFYADKALAFPPPSLADPELLNRMRYCSPD
jgi:hypothetical protein